MIPFARLNRVFCYFCFFICLSLSHLILTVRSKVRASFWTVDVHSYVYLINVNLTLQADLDNTMTTWNTHRIRPTKNQNCPHGRPMVMYMLPASYGTRRYLFEVEQVKIDVCKTECIFREERFCDEDILELCLIYMEENNWTLPATIDEALLLYSNLRNCFLHDL